jgi:hypothetical protein
LAVAAGRKASGAMRGRAILEQPFIGWHRPISHGALDHPSETITNPGRFQPSRRQEPVEAPNGLSAGRIDLSFAFLCAGSTRKIMSQAGDDAWTYLYTTSNWLRGLDDKLSKTINGMTDILFERPF